MKGSGWIIDSVIQSYTKLPRELHHPRKVSINIRNIDDNECLKWYLVRFLHPADSNQGKIIKSDKYFAKDLDLKDITFPVKVRDIHKIEKTIPSSLPFLIMKSNGKYPIYVLKKNMLIYYCQEKKAKGPIKCSYQ